LKVDVSIHQAKVKIRDARNSGANTRSESGTLVGTLALSRFATMSKHKLLKRLLAALATNDGVQPESRETWQRLKSLTPREVDVLCKILGGQLNKEIAAQLGIAERTTKVHRGHLMGKLGVQSIGQLLAMVLRVVLVDK
jgi:DNA-binding CsgD family transcriptional regulator